MHGKWVSVDHQQHDVEPPPNDVVSSMKEQKRLNEKELLDEKEPRNEEP